MAVGVATSPLGFGDVTGADSVRTHQATRCREVPFRGRDCPWMRSVKGKSGYFLTHPQVCIFMQVYLCTHRVLCNFWKIMKKKT